MEQPANQPRSADPENIAQALENQNQILRALLQQSDKTRKYLLWLRVLSMVKLLLILIPIVFGLIYLPSFVEKAIYQYKEVLPGLEKIHQFIEQEKQECPPCP